MTTTLTAQTGVLSMSIQRAARIAPLKGAAAEKSAGIHLVVRPADLTNARPARLRVQATDIELSYDELVEVLEVTGDSADWRLPSGLLAGILANLDPTTSVTLSQSDRWLNVTSGRRKAKIPLIADTFPQLPVFDTATLKPVEDLAAKLARVTWAVDTLAPPMTGVHIDGDYLIGCDTHRLAVMPCEVPVEAPITAHVAPLVPLLKRTGEVFFGATDRRLLLMPDEDTRISTLIYDQPYPKVRVPQIMRTDFGAQITVNRVALIESVSQMLVITKAEKYPRLLVHISPGEMNYSLTVPGGESMEDTIDVEGGSDYEINIAPQNLLGALRTSAAGSVTIKYGPEELRSILIEDGSGCLNYIMPIRVSKS